MTLGQDILHVGQGLMKAVGSGDRLQPLVPGWLSIAERVEAARSAGSLNARDGQIAIAVATGVERLTTSLIRLQTETDDSVNALTEQLRGIFMDHDYVAEPVSTPLPRLSKRACRSSTRHPPRPRTPPPPPPSSNPLPTHASTTHDPRSLPLRHWFLSNLAFPYPTPSEKDSIASECGITRAKVDLDMTNWRRRSGWTDMMVRFSGGDREVMREMIEYLESTGRERVGGVEGAVDGVRRYLMGEGPRVEVGWVETLPASNRKSSANSTRKGPKNARKRRSSSSSPEPEQEQTTYQPISSTRGRPGQPMPHIPSISSLSTTSTFVDPTGGGGQKRTVSGSSRYSNGTDSTYAEVDEYAPFPKRTSTGSDLIAAPAPGQATEQLPFTFQPIYASPYGLAPSSSTSTTVQNSRKRPAEAQLGSEHTKSTRFEHGHYSAPPPSSASAYRNHLSPPGTTYTYAARALTPISSDDAGSTSASESGEEQSTRQSSPSSVTDVEANYLPYASFGSSGVVLQAQAQTGGSGGGSGSGGVGMGMEGQQGIWSTSQPLARPDGWGVSGVRFVMPQEYDFAPQLQGWVG